MPKIPTRKAQYGKIINWHMEQMAYFLNKVKSLDEGGTSLLDNSMIMFGGSLKDGNRHAGGRTCRCCWRAGEGHAAARPPAARARADAALQSLPVAAASHGHPGEIVRRQHRSAQGLA